MNRLLKRWYGDPVAPSRTERSAREERLGRFGLGILKALGFVLVALVAGLLLDGAGVDAGGYLVLGALLVGVIAIYVVPLLAWRR